MSLVLSSHELSWLRATIQTSVRTHFCFVFFFFNTSDALLEMLLGQCDYSEICYERLIKHCENFIVKVIMISVQSYVLPTF